jgi:DNA-binding YbaB/EbfC family protein
MADDNVKISELLKKAQEVQKNLQDMQSQMIATETIGNAGGDAVSITMSGNHSVKRVHLSVSALNEDKSVLEDLIAAAINDAVAKIETQVRNKFAGFTGFDFPVSAE